MGFDLEHPLWRYADLYGIPRELEWDAVITANAPDLPGDGVDFVLLPDGALYTDDELPAIHAFVPLVDALDGVLDAPYHAVALRQDDDVWSVGAIKVAVLELPEEIDGDEVDVVVSGGERRVDIDGAEASVEMSSLEEFGAQQFASFKLRARRLTETLWEVTVVPL